MSKGELLSALTPSKQAKKGKKPKSSFSKAKIEKIRKEFNESRYQFSKLKIKEIRKNLYEIENKKKPLRIKNKTINMKTFFQSYTTANKLKKHKKVCENHDHCYVEMPEEHNKILKYNQGEKSMKVPFIIYADLESLLEIMNT